MWMTIGKIALIGFLVIGVLTLIVAYRRGLKRTKGQRQQPPDPNLGPSTMRGVPPTPLPEWAYWDENDENPDPRR